MTQEEDDQLFGDEHVRVYRETDGERGYTWRNGTTILLLTTKGNKSGEERTTPLIHRTDGDRYLIVASNGGTPEHPAWFHNIQGNPGDVEIQVKEERFPVEATVVEGEDRDRLWEQMVEVWPDYNDYQEKTDREIQIVALTRR